MCSIFIVVFSFLWPGLNILVMTVTLNHRHLYSDDQVLSPELGWKPVTLTDLITSSQVKIAYKKAALCVHPDKVQQKGANLEQKYVAEKVFDLLKVSL